MARQEIISDDLDGSPGASPVTFGLEHREYTIDLGSANLGRLRDALAPFIAAAQAQASGARGRTTTRGSTEREYNLVELREWAAKKKLKVPARGRVPRAIVEQYKAAGGR
jgi:Lsr2